MKKLIEQKKKIKAKKEKDKKFKIKPPIFLMCCEAKNVKLNRPKNNNNNMLSINIQKNKTTKCYKQNTIGNDINNNTNSKRQINLIPFNLKLTKKQKNILEKTKKIMNYNDNELNNLPYNLAIKYDKRKYFQYYISLLKIKHILFFTFFNNNDYNIKIIKIDLFLFNFALYYVVNAIFFNDATMHKIYEDKGSFNFVYQLPQIVYSSLVSIIINSILKLLALSEGDILAYKSLDDKTNLQKKEIKLNKKLQIKFLLYFIISNILVLFFWYYLSMFCAIYVNTQIHLIKDTLISYGLSQIYPFGIYLIPGIFRIPSLSNHKAKREILYKISKIIQIIQLHNFMLIKLLIIINKFIFF